MKPRIGFVVLLDILALSCHESHAWKAILSSGLPSSALHIDELPRPAPRGLHIAVQTAHDAQVAVSLNGRILGVVELERRERRRYYHGALEGDNSEAWRRALRDLAVFTGEENPRYQVGVLVASHDGAFPDVLLGVVEQWYVCDHHAAHAQLAYFDGKLRMGSEHPLILSSDGGGNDGFFHFYTTGFVAQGPPQFETQYLDEWHVTGSDSSQTAQRRVVSLHQPWPESVEQPIEIPRAPESVESINMGGVYAELAFLVPAVARCAEENRRRSAETAARCANRTRLQIQTDLMAAPGKLNGYAPLGTVVHDAANISVEALARYFSNADLLSGATIQVDGGEAGYRDLAATVQAAFEQVLIQKVRSAIDQITGFGGPRPDSILLTGGCALNVGANTQLHRAVNLPVHVPSAPSDCGLAVGALWMVASPPPDHASLAYAGPRIFDAGDLDSLARELHAQHFIEEEAEVAAEAAVAGGQPTCEGAALASRVASLIAEGMIVGVARGRSEHGPRALGRRSLLADATNASMQARLNKLKYREWWRPVAPIVLANDDAPGLFEEGELWRTSRYMSLAPRFTPEACAALPAVCHVDRSARLQALEVADEPWVAAVIAAFADITGKPAVICNTSFNRRGEPILNTAKEAVALLCEETELDFVVVEDYLFDKRDACPVVDGARGGA